MSLVSNLSTSFNKAQGDLLVAQREYETLRDIERKVSKFHRFLASFNPERNLLFTRLLTFFCENSILCLQSQQNGKPSEMYFSGELEKARDKKEALEFRTKELAEQLKFAQTVKIFAFPTAFVALNLARSQWSCYKLLTSKDLIDASKNFPSENARRLENLFKSIRHYVVSSIVTQNTAAERKLALVSWVRIGWQLKLLHDFQSLQAVVMGLNCPELAGDKGLWAALSKSQQEKLKCMCELMSSVGHYVKYHETFYAIRSTEKCIPNIHVAIHDLAYVEATPALAFDANSSQNTFAQIQATRDFVLSKTLAFVKRNLNQSTLYDLSDLGDWQKKHVWCPLAKSLKLHKLSGEELYEIVSHATLSNLLQLYKTFKQSGTLAGAFPQSSSSSSSVSTKSKSLSSREDARASKLGKENAPPPFQSILAGVTLTPPSSEKSSLSLSSASSPLAQEFCNKDSRQTSTGQPVSFKTIAKVAAALTYFSKPSPKEVSSVSHKYVTDGDSTNLVPGCFPEGSSKCAVPLSDSRPLANVTKERERLSLKPINSKDNNCASDVLTPLPTRCSSLSLSNSNSSSSASIPDIDRQGYQSIHGSSPPPPLLLAQSQDSQRTLRSDSDRMYSSEVLCKPLRAVGLNHSTDSLALVPSKKIGSKLDTPLPVPPPRTHQKCCKNGQSLLVNGR